ncbi:heme/hemin ABC transporter substrate-binding protein [Motilibacter aurantiacus]|uniref:heme/hemin ABC transporter substrate-binding protein n=1 Tax=Motilibacter aurantiacus TaxID=2714955 RepID=UPI00140D9EC9|nr:ABC transporter substrate-binding protein [Motilibacter aurantiacus]NHC45150.1 ABC transporter substrate-binding protein [Motilibacter aurantiacus]
MRESRFAAAGFAGVLAVALLAGCSGGSTPHGPASAGVQPSAGPAGTVRGVGPRTLHTLGTVPTPELPVTVASADGREVTVEDASRIIPLTGSIAEVVFSLGLGDNVVGRDIATTFQEAEGLPVVTHAHDVSAEGVLALKPTVLLADTDTGPSEALDQLRASGVPVVVLDTATGLDDVLPRITAVAEALGVPTAGAELAARTTAEIEAAQAKVSAGVPKPRVAFLYLRGTAGVYLLGGKGSGADSLITAAGGEDAGTALGLDAFTPITTEALVAARPDVILVMSKGLDSVGGVDGMVRIAGIAQTPAGRDRRVVSVEDGVLLSFGPRTAQVIGDLVEQLHAS